MRLEFHLLNFHNAGYTQNLNMLSEAYHVMAARRLRGYSGRGVFHYTLLSEDASVFLRDFSRIRAC